MQSLTGYIKTYINYLVIALLGLAIILSLKYRIHAVTGKDINPILLIFLIFLTLMIITLLLIALQRLFILKYKYLVISMMVAVPRLIWIFLMPTKPVSDYGCFYSYAVKASSGLFKAYDMTFTLFRFRFGYSLILAIIFRLFGSSVLVGKLFNVFLSIILCFIIFKTVEYLFDEKSAMLSVFIYAFWPSQIMYNSVLASEHPFIVFFMLGVYFIIRAVSEKKLKYALFGGISLGISNHIRPVAIVCVIALIVYILFNISKENLKILVSNILGYFLTFYAIGYIIFCLTNVPVWQTSMGLNLMIGTDYTTYGMNNIKHSRFLAKYNYDFKKMHSDAMRIGLNRIEHETGKFIKVLPRKHAIIWGDDSFGYSWSTVKVYYSTKFVKIIKSHPSIFYILSFLYYFVIIIFIMIGIFSNKKRKDNILMILYLIFLCFLVVHIFLEVQPRYHYPGIFALFLLSGEGAKALIDRFYVRSKKQD